MESERICDETKDRLDSEKATGGKPFEVLDLADASELLCNAYEIALGATESLKMLYVRLQEAYDPESALIASMLFQIGYSLDSARAMIAEADEAVSASCLTVSKEQ